METKVPLSIANPDSLHFMQHHLRSVFRSEPPARVDSEGTGSVYHHTPTASFGPGGMFPNVSWIELDAK